MRDKSGQKQNAGQEAAVLSQLQREYDLAMDNTQKMVRGAPAKRHECVHAQSPQSYLTLCNPVDCSLLGSSVLGILQTRILEPFPSPGDLLDPGSEPTSPYGSCITGRFLISVPLGKPPGKTAFRGKVDWI